MSPVPYSADWFLQWAPVIALVLSALALVGTGVNTWIVLRRGRKRVRIRSSIRLEEVEEGVSAAPLYACKITNTGYIGLQIDRVKLRSTAGAAMGVMPALPEGEEPKKPDQGETQEWGAFMGGADAGASPTRETRKIRAVAVAVDSTGKEYVQRRKDSLPVPARG